MQLRGGSQGDPQKRKRRSTQQIHITWMIRLTTSAKKVNQEIQLYLSIFGWLFDKMYT